MSISSGVCEGSMNDTVINEKAQKKITRFSFWFGFSFILNGYATGIQGISLGSLVLIIYSFITVVCAFNNDFRTRCNELLLVSFYIFLSLISMLSLGKENFFLVGMLKEWMKLLLWAIMISMVTKKYFHYSEVFKWLNRIGIVLTIYIFFQTFMFYAASIYVPNIYNFAILVPYDMGYADYDALSASSILRAGSLLSESSFYGNYAICMLCMCLGKTDEEIKNHRKFLGLAIFYSIGIVLSTSTSAIVFLPVIWLLFWKAVPKKSKVFFVLALVIVLFLVFIFVSNIDLKSLSGQGGLAESLLYAMNKFKYMGTSSRIGRSYRFINEIVGINKLVGVGCGNGANYIRVMTGTTNTYMNSITTIIMETGIAGLLAYFLYILRFFLDAVRKKDKVSFTLLLVYLVKTFVSGIAFGTYGIMFLFIAYGRLYVKSLPKQRNQGALQTWQVKQ